MILLSGKYEAPARCRTVVFGNFPTALGLPRVRPVCTSNGMELPPELRQKIGLALQAGKQPLEIAQEFGLSLLTVAKGIVPPDTAAQPPQPPKTRPGFASDPGVLPRPRAAK